MKKLTGSFQSSFNDNLCLLQFIGGEFTIVSPHLLKICVYYKPKKPKKKRNLDTDPDF